MIGLTCLTTNGKPLIAPKLNRRRAVFVLSKIDEILSWERATERERDSKFVELGRYLCEVRAGQYWRVDNVRSFDEFLERKFPESRRKAYYLMAIHEHLTPIRKKELELIGWTKARELAKVARRDRQGFECAPWVHKASTMPREEFKREVDRYLTGKETEPWEILYFKAYKGQLPVIEQALETAGLMLGSDKSRDYCLEMICADFLADVRLPFRLFPAGSPLAAFVTSPPYSRAISLSSRLLTADRGISSVIFLVCDANSSWCLISSQVLFKLLPYPCVSTRTQDPFSFLP